MKEIRLYGQENIEPCVCADLLNRNWSVVHSLSIRTNYLARRMAMDISSLRTVVEEAINTL